MINSVNKHISIQIIIDEAPEESDLTLCAFAYEIWIPWLKANWFAWRHSRRIAEQYIFPYLGHYILSNITYEDIRLWRQSLEKQRISPDRCGRFFFELKSLFQLAVKDGFIKVSPCEFDEKAGKH